MKFTAPALVLAGMLLWGCNEKELITTPAAKTFQMGDTLEVAMGDTLHDSEEFLWISLDSLVSDSRCPVDVTCVWAGSARMRYTLFRQGTSHRFELDTHPAFNPDTIVANIKISLLDVMPYPHSDSLFDQSDFSSRLIIKK